MASTQARAARRPNQRNPNPPEDESEDECSDTSTDDNVTINNFIPPVAIVNVANVAEPANVPAVVNMAVDDDPVPPFINLAVDAFDACLQRLTLTPGAIQHFHQQGFTTID
jgi:hypothetical protein